MNDPLMVFKIRLKAGGRITRFALDPRAVIAMDQITDDHDCLYCMVVLISGGSFRLPDPNEKIFDAILKKRDELGLEQLDDDTPDDHHEEEG